MTAVVQRPPQLNPAASAAAVDDASVVLQPEFVVSAYNQQAAFFSRQDEESVARMVEIMPECWLDAAERATRPLAGAQAVTRSTNPIFGQ